MLHHQHLPRLDEELFVEYDHRTGDVVLWKDPDSAAYLLDTAWYGPLYVSSGGSHDPFGCAGKSVHQSI